MAAPGDRLGGRYELIEAIGSGGMAIVWRARDTRLRRAVAVKILRPQFAEDAEFVERFESEGRHAASLAHPNVATVYDTGSDPGPDGGTRYIVMELIDGPSVAEVLRGGRLPVALAIDIAIAAARALAAAHRRGIVHRDVKPGNLLIGPDGRVRLADFGIARALATSRLTTAGTMFGSAPYMSPEQAAGDEVLPPSDLYSLGVVLYEMLHGALPDRGGGPGGRGIPGLEVDAGNEPTDAGKSGARSIPAGLDAIVARALQVDPTKRHPSARAFADALEGVSRRLHATGRAGAGVRAAGRSGRTAAGIRARKGPAVVAPAAAHAGASIGSASRGSARDAALTGDVATTRLERGVPAPLDGRPRDHHRRRPVIAALALLVGSLAVVTVGLSLANRPEGGELAATATPPLVGAAPIASSSASPGPSTSLRSSPFPSPTPSLPLSPTPTPSPTPRATPRPTPGPTAVPAVGTPSAAVADFYDAVETHDWDRAISRWSERMQRNYPPDEWLVGRFSRTTRIDIAQLRTTALDTAAGTATVALTIVEYRTVEPSPRTFAGSWELVRVGGRWLLDEPHF